MTLNDACTHTQVTHRHGTRSCYVLDKCRCPDCRQAGADGGEYALTLWTTGIGGPDAASDAVTIGGKLGEILVDCLSWIVDQESAALRTPREPEPERVEPWQLRDWARQLASIAGELREVAES